MSYDQSSKLNFLLSTERRFYKRKKPSHDQNINNDSKIFNVIRGLNTSSSIRKIHRFQLVKTQQNQPRVSQVLSKSYQNQVFHEPQFIKKQLKARLCLLLKKSSKKWKLLFDNYESLKSCTNLNSFNSQQNKFLTLFGDLVKENIQEKEKLQTLQKAMKKQPVLESKKDDKTPKINLQKIKLMRQNELLRKKCLETTIKSQKNRQVILSQTNQTIFQNPKSPKDEFNFQTFQEMQSNYKLQEQIKQLNQKIYELENENFKIKQNIVSVEDALHLVRNDREEQIKKVEQLKIQNQNICSQLVRVNLESENVMLKMQRWRSVMTFQRQEIFSYESQLSSIKTEYKDLMRKYKNVAKKSNNLAALHNPISTSYQCIRQTQQTKFKSNENFKEQQQSFQKIRSIFYNKESETTLDKSFFEIDRKTKEGYKNYLNEKQAITNTNGVKKLSREYYAYFKPNFFSFIQGYMDFNGIDLINMEQFSASFEPDCEFLATVRAIMDSKFNDFLNQNFSKTSALPNFTYAWLSKFKVQRKQKKIICIQGDLQKSVIPKFFMKLMSENLNSSWQIITFRQFLMQSLTLDELYFYLMARNYLFQGSLLDNISAVYEQICYVSIVNALNMMQRFIPDINYRKKVEQYIKKCIIHVRKTPMIDAHFLLRILLEYYQAKKHLEFSNLKSLAKSMSKNKVSSDFTFDSFMKIFEYNFTHLSIAQKIQIYKKSFSCSRGKISLEVILTVLTEQGYLCRDIKKIFCNDQIVIKKEESKEQNLLKSFDNYLPSQIVIFDQLFDKFYRQSFQNEKASFGLDEIIQKFKSVKEFDQTNIFQRIQLMFNFCLSSLRRLFFSRTISLGNFLPILQKMSVILLEMNKITCGKKQILTLMNHFKRQAAARRILRFYRKKRNQMHRNFILGIKDDLIEEDKKIQNIKEEFNQIISNLRLKPTKKEIPEIQQSEQQI